MDRFTSLFHLALHQIDDLGGNANDTAGRTAASVASLLGLLVATLAEIVSAGVDDDGAANDALSTNELDQLVSDCASGVSLAVGLEVAQVTDVTVAVRGSTVFLAVGVD